MAINRAKSINRRYPIRLPNNCALFLEGDMVTDRARHVRPTFSGTSIVTGPAGKARTWDGSDDYALLGNLPQYQLSRNTLWAWIKTDNAGASFRDIFVKSLAYGLWMQDNVFGVYDWGDSSWKTSGVNVGDGKPHLLVFVRDYNVTNGSRLYVDGVLKATITYKANTHTTNLFLGDYKVAPAGEPWAGTIYEAGMVSGCWTDAEVRAYTRENAWRYKVVA